MKPRLEIPSDEYFGEKDSEDREIVVGLRRRNLKLFERRESLPEWSFHEEQVPGKGIDAASLLPKVRSKIEKHEAMRLRQDAQILKELAHRYRTDPEYRASLDVTMEATRNPETLELVAERFLHLAEALDPKK